MIDIDAMIQARWISRTDWNTEHICHCGLRIKGSYDEGGVGK